MTFDDIPDEVQASPEWTAIPHEHELGIGHELADAFVRARLVRTTRHRSDGLTSESRSSDQRTGLAFCVELYASLSSRQ